MSPTVPADDEPTFPLPPVIPCSGAWSWSACGGGLQFRTYSVSTPASGGGAECDRASSEPMSKPCGTNCTGNWGPRSPVGSIWSTCSGGSQKRTYTVSTDASDGGAECDIPHGTSETRSCGGSEVTWTIGFLRPAESCDQICRRLNGPSRGICLENELTALNTAEEDVFTGKFQLAGHECTTWNMDCESGDNCVRWGIPCIDNSLSGEKRCWRGNNVAPCDQTPIIPNHRRLCPCGIKTAVGLSASGSLEPKSGQPNQPKSKSDQPNQPKSKSGRVTPCVGEWSLSTCSGGSQTQTFRVKVPAKGGGTECDTADNKTLTSSCGTNCVGDWGVDWSSCSGGSQTRTFSVSVPVNDGGVECDIADGKTETRSCGTNCVGAWGGWSPCSDGSQTRTFSVSVPVNDGGAECDTAHGKTERQNCATNCRGVWGPWSACRGSSQYRKYVVNIPASGGGTECPFAEGTPQTQSCVSGTPCVGDWGEDWSTCSGGSQMKRYSVSKNATGDGAVCGFAHGTPRTQSCGINCVSGWGDWSTCTGGLQTRTYVVSVPASDGGVKCATDNVHGTKETQSCGTNCVGAWNSTWSTCSGGSQNRTFSVTVRASGGGLNATLPTARRKRSPAESIALALGTLLGRRALTVSRAERIPCPPLLAMGGRNATLLLARRKRRTARAVGFPVLAPGAIIGRRAVVFRRTKRIPCPPLLAVGGRNVTLLMARWKRGPAGSHGQSTLTQRQPARDRGRRVRPAVGRSPAIRFAVCSERTV